MRCYEVKGPGSVRFAGSKADAKTKRDDMITRLNCKKKEVEIDEIDVGTSKPDIIAKLNQLAEKADLSNQAVQP